jgi:hypothetical protein
MKRTLIGALVVLAVIVAAPAGAGRLAATGYPSSMVVLGGSDAVGRGADAAHPYAPAPADSWATGTNPAVNSIYLRLLAANPAIKGHNFSVARDEVGVDDLAAQVNRALKVEPKPQLVLVQFWGDILCDGQDEGRVTQFGTDVGNALGELSRGLPGARILLVSSWGSMSSYLAYLRGLPAGARLKHAGKGPCQLVLSPTGQIEPSHAAYIDRFIRAYDGQLASVCKQLPNCRYDGGVAHRWGVAAEDISLDQEHLTTQGQAKLAAIEWGAMANFVKGL